ncbi:MAG: hypothetical protein Q4P28_05385 [Tissierellia bacterium]|nr:hypothetical protein [Tissierellia bacterium]
MPLHPLPMYFVVFTPIPIFVLLKALKDRVNFHPYLNGATFSIENLIFAIALLIQYT